MPAFHPAAPEPAPRGPQLAACLLAAALATPAAADAVPDSALASAARQRVQPALERDLTAAGLHWGDPVFLRIFKEEKVLEMWLLRRDTGKYQLFRTWPVAKMSGILGPKLYEGDRQVPEGFYYVAPRNLNPRSTYHLSFNINFPNEYDKAHGRTGSLIMVHGNAVSIGCFAMTDAKIEEIYSLCAAALAAGQPFFRVHVFPFRMTSERMALASGSACYPFWSNLREGYEIFERTHIPPAAGVSSGKYIFR